MEMGSDRVCAWMAAEGSCGHLSNSTTRAGEFRRGAKESLRQIGDEFVFSHVVQFSWVDIIEFDVPVIVVPNCGREGDVYFGWWVSMGCFWAMKG